MQVHWEGGGYICTCMRMYLEERTRGHIYDVFSQHRCCMEQGFLTYNEMKILPTTCRVEYPSSAGINYICIMNPYYDFPYILIIIVITILATTSQIKQHTKHL